MRALGRLGWLLPVLALVVALAFLGRRIGVFQGSDGAPPSGDLPVLAPAEARQHLGEHARVCGRVADARHVPGVRGQPTYLNFGGPYPDQLFTAVIWGRNRGEFDFAPERGYRRADLCVTGRIEEHEGMPQIEIRDPGQVEVGRPR